VFSAKDGLSSCCPIIQKVFKKLKNIQPCQH
jgi:hypothetical protein